MQKYEMTTEAMNEQWEFTDGMKTEKDYWIFATPTIWL